MKNLLIVGAIVVLALAGGWYWWTQQPTTNGESQDTMYRTNDGRTTPPEDTEEISETSNTFANLFSSGQSQSCTYSYTNDEGQILSGTVYVDGQRMRSDYEMMQSDETVTGSMIQDNNTMYIWASNMPEGIKMEYNLQKAMENTTDNQESPSSNPAPIDPNVEMDFDCSNWSPDSAIFTPPSDVTFRDMSAMMETLQGSPNMENRCAICDTLTESDQQTCRQQMGC